MWAFKKERVCLHHCHEDFLSHTFPKRPQVGSGVSASSVSSLNWLWCLNDFGSFCTPHSLLLGL